MKPMLIDILPLLFYGYIGVVLIIYGLKPSVSHSYYIKPIGKWFTAWCALMSIMLIVSLSKSSGLVLFPSFGFMVVGLNPNFNKWIQNKVHYIGALFIIIGGLLMVTIDFNAIYGIAASITTLLFFLLSQKMNNRIFWIEVLAFTLIFIGIKL